jgi:rod shape-determining protein MreD
MSGRATESLATAWTLLVALILAVVPLPAVIEPFRPDWVAIALLYWSLAAPERYGLLTAAVMGIVLDTLTGSLLGQHALALLVIVFLSQRFHFRIRAFPVSQVALVVIGLLGAYEFILFWIDGIAGRTVPLIERWAPVVGGALIGLGLLAVLERSRSEARTRVS